MKNASEQSRIHRPYYRNGDNHRADSDVSFNDIRKVFGFHSIKVGKWVSAKEQQLAANLFFDALCDLADILSVPTPVISLNGTLSLAYGTGGQKYVSAHYSASTRQISMAKNAGGGALAHEWFHAFDHFVAPKMYPAVTPSAFASAAWFERKKMNQHPLNQSLNSMFTQTFIDVEHGTPNAYVKRSVAIDKSLNSFYYAQPQEMAARAFESVLQDHPIKNQFLVSGTKQSTEARMGIYPTPEEKALVAQHLYGYFSALGKALEAKNTNI